jgi:hypothetical protein
MKRIKVVSALLALMATLAFGIASKPSSAMEAGKKCTCVYQSGSAGVIENNDCVVQDCWVPIDQE